MVEIVEGKLVRNETNASAMGGTEMMAIGMQQRIPQELLKNFQIIHSRTRELRDDLKKILVCHDLAGDPEVAHLKDGGYKKYDKLVFVSQWQFQQYHDFLGVPYSHSHILKNAIEPIVEHKKPNDGKIRIIYHTTPHRGLGLLYPIFDALSKQHDNIELDVWIFRNRRDLLHKRISAQSFLTECLELESNICDWKKSWMDNDT